MSALAFSDLSLLASELSLSVYSAAYLELALRLIVPLACKDAALRAAARKRRADSTPVGLLDGGPRTAGHESAHGKCRRVAGHSQGQG